MLGSILLAGAELVSLPPWCPGLDLPGIAAVSHSPLFITWRKQQVSTLLSFLNPSLFSP